MQQVSAAVLMNASHTILTAESPVFYTPIATSPLWYYAVTDPFGRWVRGSMTAAQCAHPSGMSTQFIKHLSLYTADET